MEHCRSRTNDDNHFAFFVSINHLNQVLATIPVDWKRILRPNAENTLLRSEAARRRQTKQIALAGVQVFQWRRLRGAHWRRGKEAAGRKRVEAWECVQRGEVFADTAEAAVTPGTRTGPCKRDLLTAYQRARMRWADTVTCFCEQTSTSSTPREKWTRERRENAMRSRGPVGQASERGP